MPADMVGQSTARKSFAADRAGIAGKVSQHEFVRSHHDERPFRGVSAASCAAEVTRLHVTGFGELLPRASNTFFDISGGMLWRVALWNSTPIAGLRILSFDFGLQGRFTPHSQFGHKI